LDSLQAAVVLAKQPHLELWTAARQENARRYDWLFKESRAPVRCPQIVTQRHIFNQYVIRVAQRNELQGFLKDKGISTEVYYPVPMHLQDCFAHLGHTAGAFAESERAADGTLALPVYPELTTEQARYVVDNVRDFYLGVSDQLQMVAARA
jgi:dTDP-4-amino-4,6-dideoxygalactose transaminase